MSPGLAIKAPEGVDVGRLVVLLLVGCMTNGCNNQSPTAPNPYLGPPSVPQPIVACLDRDQPALRCSAALGGVDVTTQARWSAADSFLLAFGNPGPSPSTAVDFPSPGVARPLRRANVYIRVDYAATTHTSSIAPHSYTVDPSRP